MTRIWLLSTKLRPASILGNQVLLSHVVIRLPWARRNALYLKYSVATFAAELLGRDGILFAALSGYSRI